MTTPRTPSPRDGWRIALTIAAVSNALNALWMLVDPIGWYDAVPGVRESGPLNEHFVRDVGATFLVMAVALGGAASSAKDRGLALGLVALFYLAHAGVHVWDSWRGLFPPSTWSGDLVQIYLPALLMLYLWRAAPRTP